MGDSANNAIHKGDCLCGAARYQIAGTPAMAIQCYCLSCQKLGGAGHAFSAIFQDDAFRVDGDTRGYTSTADSGNKVTTHFCPTCGSPLFARSSGYPGMVGIRVANLDTPSVFEPQIAVYTKRRQTWDHDFPSLPSFPAMPPAKPA